jgi:F0F1-type ATP synthase membrane subunit b/b'
MRESDFTISEHAKERYAQRVKGVDDDKNQTAQYIAQNKEAIEKHLQKMLSYSEVIYTGMTLNKRTNIEQQFNLRVNGNWLLLTSEDNTLITFFKKEFGFDDESFNKIYMNKLLVAIDERNRELQDVETEVMREKELLDQNLADVDNKITTMKRELRRLEALRAGYSETKNSIVAKVNFSRKELEDYINSVIGTVIFGLKKR